MIKVLVVGQTPPPYHGQALMIERLLQGNFSRVQLFHVRMAFSDSIGDIGRFRIGKVLHLLNVILRIVWHRIVHGVNVMYYPPAGPNRVPLYRDLMILGCTRWMFRRTIFHFHVMGVAEVCQRLSWPMQWLARLAFFDVDAAICLSDASSHDARSFQPRSLYIVPNGIDDEYPRYSALRRRQWTGIGQNTLEGSEPMGGCSGSRLAKNAANSMVCEAAPLRILYVGILCEAKGVSELIAACGQLLKRGVAVSVELLGQFDTSEFERKVKHQVSYQGLADHVKFAGLLRGDAKWQAFARAEAFCFPTRNDAFPVVLLEAMSFELPVVTTRSGGIPEMVVDGVTGFVVNLHDPNALADRLELLRSDAALREQMGRLGRDKFLREFTSKSHLDRMEQVFVDIAAVPAESPVVGETAAVEGDGRC